jgi:hypothetical protein
MIEKVVEHDHHQRNDQPQRQIFVKRIQMILPPAERLPIGILNSSAFQRSLGFTKKIAPSSSVIKENLSTVYRPQCAFYKTYDPLEN